MVINALSTAAAGLRASATRFDKSAADVVKAATPGSTNNTEEQGDLPTAIVESKENELSFKANAAVFKTADKMMGTLLDTIA
jgi:Domain of unknown function (DUF1078).